MGPDADEVVELRARLRELHEQVGYPKRRTLEDLATNNGWKLPPSTVTSLFKGPGCPRWYTVEAFVKTCEQWAGRQRLQLPAETFELRRWLQLHERAKHAVAGGAGSVRPIAMWDPFALDVHHAITIDGPGGQELPVLPGYARRAHDDVLDELLNDVNRSMMVVLRGGSSTGKTRALYEVVRRQLDDWPLLYPRTAAELVARLTGPLPAAGAVLWLNETQNYLSGAAGEAAAAGLRRLLDDPTAGPIVVLGTMWPGYWDALTMEHADGASDPHPQARQLLRHATRRIRIADTFHPDQAIALTKNVTADPRLRLAARTAGDSRQIIQVLAGGPVLVDRHEHPATAAQRYAAALVTAAMDAVRLGFHTLLPEALLVAAAGAYLHGDDRIDPPDGWVRVGLAEDCRPVHGVRALTPDRDQPGPGPADGYRLHDYLDQYARRTRRTCRVPATTWQALLDHANHVDDLQRLAASAKHRMLDEYAAVLYRRLTNLYRSMADGGDVSALNHLYRVLLKQGQDDEANDVLRALAATGDEAAVSMLTRHLSDHGDAHGLRSLAEAGHDDAALRAAVLMVERGCVEEAVAVLRNRVDHGHDDVTVRLAELLVAQDRVDKLLDQLRFMQQKNVASGVRRWYLSLGEAAPCCLGDVWATIELAALLGAQGNEAELRAWVGAGDNHAAAQLATLLVNHGRPEEAVAVLQARVASRDGAAAFQLAELLDELGHAEQVPEVLRAGADAGHFMCANRLAELLYQHGDVATLAARADAGDAVSADLLAEWLAVHDAAGLRARAEAGDKVFFYRWINFLVDGGRVGHALTELWARADDGDDDAATAAAELLLEERDDDEALAILQARFDAATGEAADSVAYRLIDLLDERNDVAGLRSMVDAGYVDATVQLAFLLAEQGDVEGLRSLVANDQYRLHPAQELIKLLAERGDIAGLQAEVDAGTPTAAQELIKMLAEHGDDAALQVDVEAAAVFR